MKIRNKILVYFSTTVIVLTAISFIIIYLLFAEYREGEFLQQQNKRIVTTLQLLIGLQQEEEDIQQAMDILTVYDYYDEKLLIFNENKNLIYVSKEEIHDPDTQRVLNELSPENTRFRTKEGEYDVIGIYTGNKQKGYYAISKAHDAFGYTKMFFLRNLMIGIFIVITITVISISQLLSKKISKPITALADNLNKYDLSSENPGKLKTETSSYEIRQLTERFNELLKRTNEAFAFQKHTIHHISHQLKTPIAILVSELEKINNYSRIEDIKPEIHNQIVKAKSLGNIVNVLLEISKIESGQQIRKQQTRIDEIIFDIIEELNIIYPNFEFNVNYVPEEFDERKLMVNINQILVRQAFQNIMTNCTSYSNNARAEIKIDCTTHNELNIMFINSGNPISEEEEKLLFNYFFRGQNSRDKTGFGLGLVLTKKIIELHAATISYSNPTKNQNIFKIRFPLS